MPEYIVMKPEEFNKDQKKKNKIKKDEVIKLANSTGLRLIKKGIVKLTQEEIKLFNKKKRKEEIKEESSISYELSQDILEKETILTTYDNEDMFIYKDGYYQSFAENKIREIIQIILEGKTNVRTVEETIKHIQRQTFIDRPELNKAPETMLCLKNGIFNLEDMKLFEHNQHPIFLQQIPVDYELKAKCPRIDKFLSEVVAQEDIPVIIEIAAHCLIRNYNIQKAFMFVGDGGNGKSKTLGLITALIGNENISGRAIQELLTDRFAKADLFGMFANIHADISKKALNNSTDFKSLTGGDRITGQHKFKSSFQFVNHASLIFSANRVPRTEDDTDAFFRRWIIINFPNKFNEEKADKKILEKLTTPEELSGFLNKVLLAVKRLNETGMLTNTLNIDEVREQYTRLSDSVASFLMDKAQVKSDGAVTKDGIFAGYVEYCKSMKYPQVSENTFHKHLIQNENVRVEAQRLTVNGLRVRCWIGIAVQGVQDVHAISNFNTNTKQKKLLSNREEDFFTGNNKDKEKKEKENNSKERKTPDIMDTPDTVIAGIICSDCMNRSHKGKYLYSNQEKQEVWHCENCL